MNRYKNTRSSLTRLLVILLIFLTACGAADMPDAEPGADVTQPPSETAQAAAEPVQATAYPAQPESGNAQATAYPAQPTEVSPKPAAPAGTVDTGFRPKVDGFSYENFGDVGTSPTGETFDVVNLTSVEMRRLFGDGVCAAAPKSDGTCTLTPPAQQWADENNASMNGGHCEGLAVLSQLIYDGKIDPKQFGAPRTYDLQIQGNQPLQHELAYWWATQDPVSGKIVRLAPKDAVGYLQEQYAANPKNMISIGIFKEDKTGGHAITAYAVQDQGKGVYWIMVYDNNYPGQERHITVDTNANTWEYEASINPSVEPDLYTGGPDNPIEFTPDAVRLQVFPCEFCGESAGAGTGAKFASAAALFNQIWTEGYVNVVLENEKGLKIGYDEKGSLVNEIPEAQIVPLKVGTLTEVPPLIKMPAGMGFTAYIFGDVRAAAEPASLVMIGKGYYIGIEGLVMAPEQLDQLTFDGEGDFLTYTTDAQESPDIIVGIEKASADFQLDLKAVQISKGTDIHVLFDQKEDTFAFQTTSDGPAKFSVSITRIDANGAEETFDLGSTPLTVDPGKLMYIYFGKWQGQNSSLEVGYDENGNGTIEDSEISELTGKE